MNNINELHALGQSIWYDNIQRSLLENGKMQEMIRQGEIKGVTSNPSIFHNAIAKTSEYDSALKPLAWAGLNAEEIFWELAVKDIQQAADLFAPLYRSSNKKDGYVSLEVNPLLARDAENTVKEAKRLWQKVDRPNLMIKIPATREGLTAVRQTIAAGINVNVTLIFSLKRYEEVMHAFFAGLEDRLAQGAAIDSIASVASFFVSRVDTKVDGRLKELLEKGMEPDQINPLFGKAAIANARLAYALFKNEFSSERFLKLAQKGAQKQRPLWASTSTKNPDYHDVIYVEELIGAETVNTMPPATLTAFADHGRSALTIDKDLPQSEKDLSDLEKLGIFMEVVTTELEEEGVKAFADAFTSLLKSVEERSNLEVTGLGSLLDKVKQRLTLLEQERFVERLFAHDPTLWTSDPKGQEEIRIRMDWLSAPWDSESLLPALETLLSDCRQAGFTHALLLGMGGSSLAPEVLRIVNGLTSFKGLKGLDLAVLDSTNPEEVLLARSRSPLEKTVFIVASKSGTTGEINAFFHYFWDEVSKFAGENTGDHFIAVTDPDTKLDKLAREKKFRAVFNANPRVGGRNSALTAFGLVPAALLGMNVGEFLQKTQSIAQNCQPANSVWSNPGVVLGVLLAEAAMDGRDKLTVLTDSNWFAFGNWLEQLVAESSGKEGKGIIPVAVEPAVAVEKLGNDRFFVYLGNDLDHNDYCTQVRQAGHPLLDINVKEASDLGGQFYIWEVATATACSILGVNSFDQPDVQDAKTRTLNGIAAYKETGKLDYGTPVAAMEFGTLYSNQKLDWQKVDTLPDALHHFISSQLRAHDYIALNAFLPRTPEMEKNLQALRKALAEKYAVAVTLGFGPRFLHSTGQLHKGGPDQGVFIELTALPKEDFDIPGEGLTFGTLCMAQALGDYQALEARGRRVLRIDMQNLSLHGLME